MRLLRRGELVDLYQNLLMLEKQEEEQRQAQLKEDGEPVLELMVEGVDEQREVFVVFLRHEDHGMLPKHCIKEGSQVSVSLSLDASVATCAAKYAVVTKVTSSLLELTFSYKHDFCPGQIVIVMALNEFSQSKQSLNAMTWLKHVNLKDSSEPTAPIVQMMFKEDVHGLRETFDSVQGTSPLRFINENLDASQRKAVEMALRNQPLAVIHGPPGTGKTTTIVEVILQHVQRGQRVMVCAPSNKAVDNLLESLWKQNQKISCGLRLSEVTRLGNLARMDEKHRQFSHTVKLRRRMERKEKGKNTRYQNKERAVELAELLRETLVLMSTLSSVQSVQLGKFDLLVIDECGQATEPACWLAIPLAKKVLLAGDPLQLPPTILSQEAARRGLAVSLMERQMQLHGEDVVHMLDTQYRMHELIQVWSSHNLYDNKLKASPRVATRLLTDLPGVRSTPQTQPTLLLIDTARYDLKETKNVNTSSYSNPGEADLVVCHARSLVSAGLQAEDIGVITPYKQQVKLISDKMRAAGLMVEVNSVDGYQGREKEAILLSLVRSNHRRQVGFVGDQRRLNVAVTRARRQLFVVCDTTTVCQNKNIRSLVKHLDRNGETRSAHCERCPGGQSGRYSSAVPVMPPPAVATSKHELTKPVDSLRNTALPANGEAGATSAAGLTRSMDAMTLGHRSAKIGCHSANAPPPAARGTAASASVFRGFAASASVTRGCAAGASVTRFSGISASDTHSSAHSSRHYSSHHDGSHHKVNECSSPADASRWCCRIL